MDISGSFYRLIDITNSIIKGGDEFIEKGDNSEKLMKNVAEAKVLEHIRITLYRLFKTWFKTEPTNPETAFDRPSTASSKEDIFKLIREDLQFASENLPYVSSDFGRWNKGAVDHLRAKVEMWDENYSLVEIVDEIINEGPYSLVYLKKCFQVS